MSGKPWVVVRTPSGPDCYPSEPDWRDLIGTSPGGGITFRNQVEDGTEPHRTPLLGARGWMSFSGTRWGSPFSGTALFFQDPRGGTPSQEPGGAMVQVEDCFFQEPLFRNPVVRLVVGNPVDLLFQEPDSGFPFSGTRLQFSACSGIRWLIVLFRNHVFRNPQRSRLSVPDSRQMFLTRCS